MISISTSLKYPNPQTQNKISFNINGLEKAGQEN